MTHYPFLLARNRDAWASIRGYVYQVDLTIRRWLDLGPGDVLELERGEDIDLISNALLASGEEQVRLLEQVKHREGNVTLRSAPAVSAIVNAYEHREANPHHHLIFRFTTNAGVAREQLSPMPGNLRGIEAWEMVRAGTLADDARHAVLAGLRTLVLDATRPDDISEAQWTTFQGAWKGYTDGELLDFISRFEWSTHATGADSLRESLVGELVRLGLAGDAGQGNAVYQRLFAFVFRTLSQPGIKRLAKGDLDSLLAQPVLTSEERALIATLTLLHRALEDRVDDVEAQVRSMRGALALTTTWLDDMAAAAGVRARYNAATPPPVPLGEPPLVTRASMREEALAELMPSGWHPWVLALYGPAASGKTQLALLAAREIGDVRGWVRLSVSTPEAAAQRLSSTIAMMCQVPHVATNWADVCRDAVGALDVLVLDGVPPFRQGDALGELLVPMIRVCRESNVPVLLTSEVPLRNLERAFDDTTLVSAPVPLMREREVWEVLVAYGAAGASLSKADIRIITAVTAGQPVLVQAAAQFLADRGWALDGDVFSNLIRRAYTDEVNAETLRLLLNEVADQPTRELLYRLTIPFGEFGEEELDLLASAPPPITAVRERMVRLVGPWVEPVGRGRYELSPLVRNLGDGGLTLDTRRACHRLLAEQIVSRERIGQIELMSAVRSFAEAGEYRSAGIILLRGLHAIHESSELPVVNKASWLITRIWRSLPLPAEMDAELRMQIRAFQVVLSVRGGEEFDGLLDDLDQLLASHPKAPAMAVFGSCIVAGLGLASRNVARAARYIVRATQMWPEMRPIFEGATKSSGEPLPDPGTIYWISARAVRDQESLDAWLAMVSALEPERAQELFETTPAEQLSAILANGPTLWEFAKRDLERNWSRVVKVTLRMEDVATSKGILALLAGARSARITALGMTPSRMKEAVALGEASVAEFSDRPDAAFLCARALAYALMDAGCPAEAERWFVRADAYIGRHHGRARVQAKLWLGAMISHRDPQRAAGYAAAAGELALRVPSSLLVPIRGIEDGTQTSNSASGYWNEVDHWLVAQAYAELAVARWRNGEMARAFDAWEFAVANLLEEQSASGAVWRSTAMAMGHAAVYLGAIAQHGSPPKAFPTGDEYVAPYQGMFLGSERTQELAGTFRPGIPAILMAQTAQFGAAVGNDTAALAWAERAFAALAEAGMWDASVPSLDLLTWSALVEGRFGDAIQHERLLNCIFLELGGSSASDLLASSPDPLLALADEAGVVQQTVDAVVLTQVVLPAFIRVAHEALRDTERGRELATTLRDACSAAGAGASPGGVWDDAAELCDLAFVRGEAGSLLERSQEFREQGTPAATTLGLIAHFAACTRMNTPRDALWCQMQIAEYLLLLLSARRPRVIKELVVPYFVDFWLGVLDRRFFEIEWAPVTAFEVAMAAAGPVEKRLPRTLLALARALEVDVPESAAEFIYGALS